MLLNTACKTVRNQAIIRNFTRVASQNTKSLRRPNHFQYNHLQTRAYSGFWDVFKQTFRSQQEASKEVQELRKQLEEDKTYKVVQELKEQADKQQEAISENIIKPVIEGMDEGVQKLAESEVMKNVGKTVDYISETTQSIPIVKQVVEDLKKPVYDVMANDYFRFRSRYGRDKDKEEGLEYNPYTKQMETIDESTHDTTTTEIIASDGKETEWNTGFVSKFKEVFKFATRGNEVLNVIKERDPTFNLPQFTKTIELILAPRVVEAYFNDDEETLRRVCSEEAFSQAIMPKLLERKSANIKYKTRILEIKDVELHRVVLTDTPQLVYSFQVQYVNCMVSTLDGSIVSGGKSDVTMQSHFWVLQLDPTMETSDWEIGVIEFGEFAALV